METENFEHEYDLEEISFPSIIEIKPKSNLLLRIFGFLIIMILVFYYLNSLMGIRNIFLIFIVGISVISILLGIFMTSSSRVRKSLPSVEQQKKIQMYQDYAIKNRAVQLKKEARNLNKQVKYYEAKTEEEISKTKDQWENTCKTILNNAIQYEADISLEIKNQTSEIKKLKGVTEKERKDISHLKIDKEGEQNKVEQLKEQKSIRERLLEDTYSQEQQRQEIKHQQLLLDLENDLSSYEDEWQDTINNLKNQKEFEIEKLEKQLGQEEQRRIMLEERRNLELAQSKIKERYQQQSFQNIEDSKSNLLEISQILNKIKNNLDTREVKNIELNKKLDSLLKEIDVSVPDLDTHINNTKRKYVLLNTLNLINTQISKLGNSLSYQRAAPVLMVSSKPDVPISTKTAKKSFLCESCYRPISEITLKIPKKFVQWELKSVSILLKHIFDMGISEMVSKLNSKLGSFPNNPKDIIKSLGKDINIDIMNFSKDLEKIVKSFIISKDLIDKDEYLDEINEMLNSIVENLRSNNVSVEEAVKLTYLYFEKMIKRGDFKIAMNYLDDRDILIWNNFSHHEQEEIRNILKDSNNSQVFTHDLSLYRGLYICKDCVEWLDSLKSNKP